MRKFKVFVVLGIALFMPFSAKACEMRPYAQSYIDSIHRVFGGTKPKLVIEKGSNKVEAAFYDGKAIHIYKNDYKGKCVNETPYLKSVIAHEYAHHLSGKLRTVTNLKGEKIAYVAEHSIADTILGGEIEYDGYMNLVYPKADLSIRKMISEKQTKIIAKSNSSKIYFKSKKISK